MRMNNNKSMELREYVRILRKNLTSILAITAVFTLGVAAITLRIPEKHEAQLAVYVHKSAEQPQSGDFTYDGYYAQLAAEAFADTVVGLFESTTTAKHALEIAGMDSQISAVRSLHAKVDVEKVAPQLVEISVTDADQQYAIDTVEALYTSVEEEVTATNRDSGNGLSVQRINAEPLVLLKQQILWLNTLVGFLVGIIVSITVVAIKVYAQDNKHHE